MKCGLKMSGMGEGILRKSKDVWSHLFKNETKTATIELYAERMKGLQSYNFRDSPDFREAKKVEKRVKSRDDRNRERLDEKAAVYKQEALQAI